MNEIIINDKPLPISSTYTFGREVVKHTGAKTKAAHHNGKVMRVYTDD